MSRVEWTRLSGDETENLIAGMLLQEFEGATHIRPSRGDAGIDVYVPNAERTAAVVFQIKRYSDSLESNEKRAIENSVKRLANYHPQRRYPVSACHITLPLNPTNENDTWLQGLEDIYQLPLDWRSLTYLDTLAAKYPELVDYYCHGGRQSVADAVGSLTGLVESALRVAAEARDDRLTASDATNHLIELRANINRIDPFYKYDFAVSEHPPVLQILPGLISSGIVGRKDGPYVTINVYEKFPGAADLRPTTVEVRFTPSDEDRGALEDFFKFGLPAEVPAEFDADLPGGLGGSHSGTVRVGPTEEDRAQTTIQRWTILEESGEEVCEVQMRVAKATGGPRMTGMAVQATERYGTFSALLKFDVEAQQANISFSLAENLEGSLVTDLREGLDFLVNLNESRVLQMSPQFGPKGDARQPLAGLPAPPENWIGCKAIVDFLVSVQQRTNEPITFPDPHLLTREKLVEIQRAGKLAAGEEIAANWGDSDLTVTLEDRSNTELFTGPSQLLLTEMLSLSLGDRVYPLGEVAYTFDAAVPAGNLEESEGEGYVQRFRPLEGRNGMTIKLVEG